MSKLLIIGLFLLSITQSFAAVHHVSIKDFKFNPSEIIVETGDTIHFMNDDQSSHSVIPTPLSNYQFTESARMRKGATFSLVVETEDSFAAQCGIHLRMPGLLVSVENEE